MTGFKGPPPKQRPAQAGIIRRAAAAARAWAATQTGCGTCNRVRAAAARVIGQPKR